MDHDEIAAGHQAKAELKATERAFAILRQEMLERIATSGVYESAHREALYFGVQQLDAVKTALLRMVDAGEAANARQILNETLFNDTGD